MEPQLPAAGSQLHRNGRIPAKRRYGLIMATVHIPDIDKSIRDPREINEFLAPFGIQYERWDVAGRIGAEATDQEILDAYSPEIERLKQQGGYVTADVINVNPGTPGLDEMLARFDKEHTHSEDEVRFTVEGRGVFHIHPEEGPVFSITVEAGDLMNVPRGTRHWFNLCSDKRIRCIRLFEDMAGWTPHYVSEGRHADYEPLCMGPQYFPREEDDRDIDPVVRL
jgi:1,2-dihydroxy-3-keto-5-methylthiopentene dioxygenase